MDYVNSYGNFAYIYPLTHCLARPGQPRPVTAAECLTSVVDARPLVKSWQARYDYNFAAIGIPGLTFMTRCLTGDNVYRDAGRSRRLAAASVKSKRTTCNYAYRIGFFASS